MLDRNTLFDVGVHVPCPLSIAGYLDFTMTFVFPPFQLSIYMGYLVGGYLVDMCVCVSTVSTSLLKSRYDMIGMLQLMSGKKNQGREARHTAAGSDLQVWRRSVVRFISIN